MKPKQTTWNYGKFHDSLNLIIAANRLRFVKHLLWFIHFTLSLIKKKLSFDVITSFHIDTHEMKNFNLISSWRFHLSSLCSANFLSCRVQSVLLEREGKSSREIALYLSCFHFIFTIFLISHIECWKNNFNFVISYSTLGRAFFVSGIIVEKLNF